MDFLTIKDIVVLKTNGKSRCVFPGSNVTRNSEHFNTLMEDMKVSNLYDSFKLIEIGTNIGNIKSIEDNIARFEYEDYSIALPMESLGFFVSRYTEENAMLTSELSRFSNERAGINNVIEKCLTRLKNDFVEHVQIVIS
ncbi:gp282 [Sphingomonas phage PAU]|uniref:gp282 n=1 Tax=Sphingomonas phage PAU TaxID=1150991 RepID=UPI0002573499|nr:gp282 [Sphingomonas phage PAU]AFF28280.1 gp282 [Sphingomonas phage PAU]